MRPNSVVSAAPTMAIDFGFMAVVLYRAEGGWSEAQPAPSFAGRRVTPGICRASPALRLRRPEEGEGDLVVHFLEGDLDRHVELQCLRGLRAIDDVRHQARPLVELDDGNRIRRGEARHRPVVNHIAVEPPLAAGAEHADLARGAMRTERPRWEIDLAASIAALQAQFAGLRA